MKDGIILWFRQWRKQKHTSCHSVNKVKYCITSWQLEALFAVVASFFLGNQLCGCFLVPEDCLHVLLYWLLSMESQWVSTEWIVFSIQAYIVGANDTLRRMSAFYIYSASVSGDNGSMQRINKNKNKLEKKNRTISYKQLTRQLTRNRGRSKCCIGYQGNKPNPSEEGKNLGDGPTEAQGYRWRRTPTDRIFFQVFKPSGTNARRQLEKQYLVYKLFQSLSVGYLKLWACPSGQVLKGMLVTLQDP